MTSRHLYPPYSFRMPDDLRAELERIAKENGRSLNAEILLRLQASLDQVRPDQTDPADLLDRLRALEARVDQLERERTTAAKPRKRR